MTDLEDYADSAEQCFFKISSTVYTGWVILGWLLVCPTSRQIKHMTIWLNIWLTDRPMNLQAALQTAYVIDCLSVCSRSDPTSQERVTVDHYLSLSLLLSPCLRPCAPALLHLSSSSPPSSNPSITTQSISSSLLLSRLLIWVFLPPSFHFHLFFSLTISPFQPFVETGFAHVYL